MPALEIVDTCPVCGDGIPAAPRRCERCDTPHHEECWQYVPGCAVFGCGEGTAPAREVATWSEAHQLALSGMRWVGMATTALQGVLASFLLTLAGIGWLGHPPAPALALFGATIAATLGSMFMAFRVKWAIQGSEAGERLRELEVQGDRRLAQAVQERVGRTVPLPPSVATLLLLIPVVALIFGSELAGLWRAGAALDAYLFLVGPVGIMGLAIYGCLKLPARWVGYQRIMANRLGAAIEAGRPRKGLPG